MSTNSEFNPITESSFCTLCGCAAPKSFVETFITSTDYDSVPLQVDLCGMCLIGRDVPVYMGTKGWTFATVKSYDSSQETHPFLMLFANGAEEWYWINRRPTVDYLSAYACEHGRTDQSASPTISSEGLASPDVSLHTPSPLSILDPIDIFEPTVPQKSFKFRSVTAQEPLKFEVSEIDLSPDVVHDDAPKRSTKTKRYTNLWTPEEE
mmetsp:Transcript_25261/g.53628  ORF Transcript_25261/g.53628 Transcript_25261/m.53628 type:complete len:208 (-) Transcript_25261:35-658(-)